MGKIPELLETSILAGYCIYRILTACYFLGQNAKFASENEVYGWLENHNWPEIEIAFAIMAIIGLIFGRRFVFCFTVFFFVLRTIGSITDVAVDVYTLSSGKSISCITNEYFSSDLYHNCNWSDISIIVHDFLTFISLALMSAILFIRLFGFIPVGNNRGNEPVQINHIGKQQQTIMLPLFMKEPKKQKENDSYRHEYDINYDDNPYKSSVI